ncbi:MAG: TonB-dependent receptor [Sphingobacterium sp.]
MKLNTVFKHATILTLLLGMGIGAKGQVRDTADRPVTLDSFDIVRDYRPILADAVKIRRSPDMSNKREYMPTLNYGNVPDKKLDINTGLKELKRMETPFSELLDLRSNYVKFGAGNFNTILGEAYFAVEDYEDIRFGGFVKHLSQKGALEAQKFSRQEVGVFGRRVLPLFTLDGVVGYNGYGTNFYGIPEDAEGIPLNPTREAQRFNDIYFTGELTSNFDPSNEDAVSYSAKVDAYAYSDKFSAKENSIALSGYLNKRYRAFNAGANVSLDYNAISGVNTPNGSLNNSVASINPYIRFKGDNYNITLGANIVSEFGDSSRFNVFPEAEIDFSLVPEYFYIFGGITGGVEKGSFREFSRVNPYLGPNLTIQNTIERMNIYGGIKGNAGATFGYKVKGFYRKIEGMAMFVNNAESPFMFDLIYDGQGDDAVKHVGLEGEINVRLSEVVNLGGRLNIDQYTMVNQEEAWHIPNMRLAANARFNISEKLYIDAEALFHGVSHARGGMPTQTDQQVIAKESIDSFLDLSAGAEYRATKQLGIFVKANNLLNTEYQRYLYYPKLGFNILGGVNFSF